MTFGRHLRFREAVFTLDQQLSVLGSGTREADPSPDASHRAYREAPMRLRFTGSAKHPLVLSDDPRLSSRA